MVVLVHVHPRLALDGDEFKVRVALRALAVRMHEVTMRRLRDCGTAENSADPEGFFELRACVIFRTTARDSVRPGGSPAFPSQNSGTSTGIGLESAVSMDRIPAVASVMTPFPYSIDVVDSLRRARGLMVEHEIRHLPVLHGQTLVGVLSDRDIKRALDPEMGLPPRDELLVRDAYVSEPYAVDASTALDVVLEYMAAHQVGSAIVTKHGRLAGIFTATDACRIYCEHLRRLFPSRSGEEVA